MARDLPVSSHALFHASHRFQQIECLFTYLADGFGESALSESSSKSANAFPMISSAARVWPSFTSALASRFRSRSFSVPGRPLCTAAETAAADDLSPPETRALRQRLMCAVASHHRRRGPGSARWSYDHS